MLIVRDLSQGPRRTMELINGLFPISSRTLIDRLRDMENDEIVIRHDYGGNPQHIEYELTARGRLLVPLADMLRQLGEALGCHECEDRKDQIGMYCELCPYRARRLNRASINSRTLILDQIESTAGDNELLRNNLSEYRLSMCLLKTVRLDLVRYKEKENEHLY
jgi:DNA-binding HxlR family transcriptional regulator